MESIECFCIDLAFTLDFKGDVKSLALGNNWNIPCDFDTSLGFVCRHFNIASLLSTCTTDVPVFDRKVRWNDISDEDILESSITVVLEQDEYFVSTLSTHWNRLLSSREVSSKVADSYCWCFRSISYTNRSKLLGTELESCRCIDSFICR